MHTAGIASLQLPPLLERIIPHLGLGVVLFFVVSAYSLLHSHERVAGTEGWRRAYFLKRFFRIAPLFWFMLCIYLIHPFYGGPPSFGEIAANFLFVFNFLPGWHESLVPAGWTIGVEMPFYLLLPFVIDRIRGPRDALLLLVAAMAVSLGTRSWISSWPQGPGSYVDIAFLPNVADFVVGMLAYHVVRRGKERKLHWRLIGLAGVAVLATLPLGIRLVEYFPSRPDILVWAFALGMICVWQAAAPSRLLSTSMAQWLGERSYGIYLLHPLVIFSLLRSGAYTWIYEQAEPIGNWAYVLCAGLTLCIVLPAAALVYQLIEMPGQKLGGRVIRRLQTVGKRSPNLADAQ